MRPQHLPIEPKADLEGARGLRAVASASFRPRGPGYDPRVRLKRRFVALRGGEHALIVAFGWVRGEVRVRLLTTGSCSSADCDQAVATARSIAAVDDDPSEFLVMVRDHPVLGRLSRVIDPRIACKPTVFESFAIAVIEQLVTGYEARASARRLWRIAGEPVPSTRLRAAPTGAAVKRVPMWKLHAIGIGSKRALTLHEGAGRADALERLRSHPAAVAVEKLQSLRGVGPWTANAVARSGLGWADAVPVGDFHAPYTITAALGGPDLSRDDPRAADAALLEVLEPFRPHRARVALLLEGYQLPGARPWRLPRVDPHRREPWRY